MINALKIAGSTWQTMHLSCRRNEQVNGDETGAFPEGEVALPGREKATTDGALRLNDKAKEQEHGSQ